MPKYLLWMLVASITLFSCQNNETTDEYCEPIYEYGIPIDSFDVVRGQIKKGESISQLFAKLGATNEMVNQLNLVKPEVFDMRKVRAGNNYSAYYTFDTVPQLIYVIYHNSITDHTVFHLQDSLHIHPFQKDVRSEIKLAQATITTSLWDAAIENNLNIALALNLSDIYAWSIDFFGLQPNDSFSAYYEELYVDSISIGIGEIYVAKFTHRGKNYYAFNFQNDDVSGFWDENGQSLRKAFLKAPLKFSRISSGFSYARKHPVYKTVRPHTGVDYAAPQGTPVMSIGDGTVIQKGYKGGGGNTVKIRHNSIYSSAYLHLSRYAKGLTVGSKVQQGQVIGYVGSTGASTGAHLDFRVWKNNTPINPLTMESPPVEPIPQKYMTEFKQLRDSLIQKIDTVQFVN